MRSLPLRKEPTVREADAILAGMERVLADRGVPARRRGLELRFRTPWPWQAPRLGTLVATSGGLVKVSAGAGEPWMVRYTLRFTALRALAIVASVAAVVAGFGWPRLTLFNALVAVWVLLFLVPRWVALRRFEGLLREHAGAVLERRSQPRDVASTA